MLKLALNLRLHSAHHFRSKSREMLNALDEKMLERKRATRALRQQNAALSTASSIRRTNSLKMSEPYSPLRDFHGSLYHRSTARLEMRGFDR